ncbi:hypothetical protein RN001_012489 [Aquatica leii]|uniref:HTH OST-type domain-containing protein n=1 Tax=Aquatica leii TaxID=1421715 RepID=A0AAN7PUG6_9COLE|nr:hypothetical protein RN001_012489 [Aquatica leii]
MSLYKPSPKNPNQRDSNERSPQAVRQNLLEQFNNSGSIPNEATARSSFQYLSQGNLYYNQQQNPPWSPYYPQVRMPNEYFENMTPVDLIVSNLDISIDTKEILNMLLNMFQQYCTILNLTFNLQANILVANVKVANYQEAQVAISQLDSRWLGCKRINNVPGQCMPLFKFFEIVRCRYLTNISLSDINNLEDVCKITDGLNGRMIVLNQKVNFTLPLPLANVSKYLQQHLKIEFDKFQTLNYYCTIHCPNGLTNPGWGESYDFLLPNIRISLRYFQNQVHQLLIQHMGCMPLLSFPVCYALQFKQTLLDNEAGVPLEHLVTCFSSVDLISNDQNKNIKYLKLKDPKDIKTINLEDVLSNTISPAFFKNVAIFCREMVDLLKNVENCQLLVSCYIPTYYRHFGRQCRVADYGFNRLSDLFEAISHVVQMRRFTIDLLRVIKSQKSKKISIVLFPHAYEQTFFRPFNPVEYGLCTLEDLLCSLQEGTVVFSKVDNIDVVSIPKKEQTVEEIKRTKKFIAEVKEILRHFPYCKMPLNKFLPSYHHYFEREFKVTDYGFTKLIELFEAIPETVEIDGFFDTDRMIMLTLEPLLEVTGTQLVELIRRSNLPELPFEEVITVFRQTFGYTLKPEMYDCATILELFIKLSDFVQVCYTKIGPTLSAVSVEVQVFEIRLWVMLLHPPHKMELKKLKYYYRLRFESNLSTNKLQQVKSIEVSTNVDTTQIRLTQLYILAARIYHLLVKRKNRTQLGELPDLYLQKYGTHLHSRDYGAKSLKDLLYRMSFLVTISGKDKNLYVTLKPELSDYGLIPKHSEPECFTWPPPPLHLLVRRSHLFTPPKPDTPSLSGCWSDAWNFNKETADLHLNLQLSLPAKDADRSFENPTNDFVFIPQNTSMTFSENYLFHDDSGYSGFNVSRQDTSMFNAEMNQSQQLYHGSTSQPTIFNMSFNRSM